jgi:hypothetical protein
MAYKFLPGDMVRRIGKSDESTVARPDETGERYLLTQNRESDALQIWVSENELEIVKRASDSYTGWAKPGLYVS